MKKIVYVMMILIWSCQDSTKELIDNPKKEFESIELIDTFKNKLQLDTANSITEAEFYPMYMGTKKNSIMLNYWSGEIEYKSMNRGQYKRPDSSDLKILVDTTQIIGSVNRFIIPPPPPPNMENESDEYKWERKIFRGDIKSYPIIVKNLTKDTLNVGYGEYIPLIIEAKDSLENWRPIQEPYIYFCGTGLTNYFLPPNEIIISSCKLYEGEYETKMRVVFGFDRMTKSNDFIGKINYKQFDEPKEKFY